MSGGIISTWLYADSAAEDSEHYQVRGGSATADFQAVYWRSVGVFFATSVRQNPNARRVLFTNVTSPPVVDGVPMAGFLESLDVELVRLPLTFRTPRGYYHEWRNQFYVFDILRWLAEHLAPSDVAVVLDSDCAWVSDVEPMWDALRRDGSLTYVVRYDPDWKNNGLSRTDMSRIAAALLEHEVRHPLVYCGGELVAVTGLEAQALTREVDTVWAQLMDRHARSEAVFHEEGQTLSYIYYKLGYPLGNGDPFIRRIFTDAVGRHNNAEQHDNGLVVWHVPLEKRLGIRRLFATIETKTAPLWSLERGPSLRRYLGSMLGVPDTPISKRVRDLTRRGVDKLPGR
jgi:hypothetical protein